MFNGDAARDRITLSVTLGPLLSADGGWTIRQGMERIASLGLSHVHFAATLPGLRPRELDRPSRRDVLSVLRRLGLSLSGIDLWIPAAHFRDPASRDRAMDATLDTITLAADLGRVPVSTIAPDCPDLMHEITTRAQHSGVAIVDHAVPPKGSDVSDVGIDPAAWLSAGMDPVQGVYTFANLLRSARLVDVTTGGLRIPAGAQDGRLDVAAYAVALSVSGFRKPMIIDARQWNSPWHGVEASVSAWKAVAAP